MWPAGSADRRGRGETLRAWGGAGVERETSCVSLSGSLDSSCSGVREIRLHLAVNPQGLEQA